MTDDVATPMIVTILGRIIGIATGWDRVADNEIVFYDFAPSEDFAFLDEFKRQKEKFPRGFDLNFNDEQGLFKIYDETGDLQDHWDVVHFLDDYDNFNVARR